MTVKWVSYHTYESREFYLVCYFRGGTGNYEWRIACRYPIVATYLTYASAETADGSATATAHNIQQLTDGHAARHATAKIGSLINTFTRT